jgi:integrase
MRIVNEKGQRLYFTEEQRKALLAAAAKAPREVRSFCSVLCYTGCRISEALALTAKSIDLSDRVIVIESLKKNVRLAPTGRCPSRQSCSISWIWSTAFVRSRRKAEPGSMSLSGHGAV